MESRPIFISLGSNVGDRLENLSRAVQALLAHYSPVRQSPVYETEPQDVASQPRFLNMVVGGTTGRSPQDDLSLLLEIELALGRSRDGETQKGPRTIDLDLLLHGDEVLDAPSVTVPHPRMYRRRFVLVPLLAIAPEICDPRSGTRFDTILADIPPQGIYYAYPAAYNGLPPYGGSSSRA